MIAYTVISRIFTAVSANSLKKLTDLAVELFGNPVIVIDPSYNVLCSNPNEKIGDKYWDSQMELGHTPASMITSGYNNGYRQRALSGDGVTVLDWGDIAYKRLIGNIMVDDVLQGFITVCYMDKSTPTEEHFELMRLFNQAFGIVIKNGSNFIHDFSSQQAKFISMLFEGRELSESELEEWKAMTGLQLDPRYAILCVEPKYEDEYAIKYLTSVLNLTHRTLLSEFTDGYRYFLIMGVRQAEDYADLYTRLEVSLRELRLRAGLSQPFNHISDIRTNVGNARNAMDAVRELEMDCHLGVYDKIIDQIIILQAAKGMSSQACLHTTLHQLRGYDEEYKTSYYNSLKTYLFCMCDSHQAARELHVHRNTMLYRLNRISELCQLDITNTDLCRRMLISISAFEIADKDGK